MQEMSRFWPLFVVLTLIEKFNPSVRPLIVPFYFLFCHIYLQFRRDQSGKNGGKLCPWADITLVRLPSNIKTNKLAQFL